MRLGNLPKGIDVLMATTTHHGERSRSYWNIGRPLSAAQRYIPEDRNLKPPRS